MELHRPRRYQTLADPNLKPASSPSRYRAKPAPQPSLPPPPLLWAGLLPDGQPPPVPYLAGESELVEKLLPGASPEDLQPLANCGLDVLVFHN
eukprot:5119917-Prymnesium_polylepis.1